MLNHNVETSMLNHNVEHVLIFCLLISWWSIDVLYSIYLLLIFGHMNCRYFLDAMKNWLLAYERLMRHTFFVDFCKYLIIFCWGPLCYTSTDSCSPSRHLFYHKRSWVNDSQDDVSNLASTHEWADFFSVEAISHLIGS